MLSTVSNLLLTITDLRSWIDGRQMSTDENFFFGFSSEFSLPPDLEINDENMKSPFFNTTDKQSQEWPLKPESRTRDGQMSILPWDRKDQEIETLNLRSQDARLWIWNDFISLWYVFSPKIVFEYLGTCVATNDLKASGIRRNFSDFRLRYLFLGLWNGGRRFVTLHGDLENFLHCD